MWIVGLVMTIVVDGSDGDGCCGGDCDSVVVLVVMMELSWE